MTALLRRVLPEVPPQVLASILGVQSLPPKDFSIISESNKVPELGEFDPSKAGILDVFLACIAKSLTVQMKVKGNHAGMGKGLQTLRLKDCLVSRYAWETVLSIYKNQNTEKWIYKSTSYRLSSYLRKRTADAMPRGLPGLTVRFRKEEFFQYTRIWIGIGLYLYLKY